MWLYKKDTSEEGHQDTYDSSKGVTAFSVTNNICCLFFSSQTFMVDCQSENHCWEKLIINPNYSLQEGMRQIELEDISSIL